MPTIAFSHQFPDLTDAKPKALRLGAASYETSVWTKVLEVTARALLESYHYHQAVLSAVKQFTWFGHTNHGMTRPCELDKCLWIELNQGSKGIIVRTRKLLEACGYPLEKAALVYEASHVATAPPSSLMEESRAKPAEVAQNVSVTQPSSSIPMLSEDAFVRYVADTSTDNNAKKCRTGIRKISRILADMGLVKSNIFEIVALDQLRFATTTLRENAEYLAEDKRSNGWLRSPLNHYLCFAETVLCNSSHPVLPSPPTNPAKSKSLAQVQPSLPGIPPSGKHAKKKAEKKPYTAHPNRDLFSALAEDKIPEKIGAYAKRMLFQALAENGRIPDEDFITLQSVEGTKELLGISLTTCPLFSLAPMVRRDGGRGSWADPATHDGKPVYVNSQWYEEHREKLDRLLARWRFVYTTAPQRAVRHLPSQKESGMMPEIEKNIVELLEAEFPNGMRPGDFIDQRKLRKFYKEYFETELPADFPFAEVLPCLGIVHDGKVFPRPSEKGGGWRKIVDGLAAQGHRIFQFSRVMQRHAKELMRLGVTSSEMLREVMSKSASDAYEIKDGFFIAKSVPPRDLIPADAVLVEEKDLAKAFPYVDEEEIRNLLRNVPGAIRNGPGSWAVSDRIAFDEDETAAGRDECSTAVANDGFFSLAQLHLENSVAMNDHRLADGTLRRLFFQRFLSEEFDLAGQIVHAKGSAVDAAVPLRLFLRNRTETTLAEIEDLAREYNIFISKALETACEETVRVSRDRFVSPCLVAFDAAAVDEAVAARCVGGATPLCEFSGFADFPAVPGFVWNEFLLESFLRRESRRFRLFSASSAAKDASGAVAEKSAPFADAPSAFAAAAFAGNVDPEPESVGDFLIASRCALRRGRELVAAVVSAMHSQKRSRK